MKKGKGKSEKGNVECIWDKVAKNLHSAGLRNKQGLRRGDSLKMWICYTPYKNIHIAGSVFVLALMV